MQIDGDNEKETLIIKPHMKVSIIGPLEIMDNSPNADVIGPIIGRIIPTVDITNHTDFEAEITVSFIKKD